MGNKKLIRNEKGFTLIELLIAIAVAALLIVPTYRVLIQGQAVQSKAFSQAGMQEKTQKVLNQIAAGAAAQDISGLRESSKVSYKSDGIAYIVGDKMFTYYFKDNTLFFNSQPAPTEPQVSYSGGKAILNDVQEFTVTSSDYLYEIALAAGKDVAQGGKAEAAFAISVFAKNIKINEKDNGGEDNEEDDDDNDQRKGAKLINLKLSSGNLKPPKFKTDITTYTAKVNKHTSTTTVTPTLDEPEKATVTVNGKTVKSGKASDPIPLKSGDNTISIVVTAEDGTTKTYTIIVNRKNTNDNNGGGNDEGDDDDDDDDKKDKGGK